MVIPHLPLNCIGVAHFPSNCIGVAHFPSNCIGVAHFPLNCIGVAHFPLNYIGVAHCQPFVSSRMFQIFAGGFFSFVKAGLSSVSNVAVIFDAL
jgi:hypothetical protein